METLVSKPIKLTFTDLPSYLQQQNSLHLKLLFPDRREFIACRHPGMNDRYFLDVTLTFTEESTLDDVTFEVSSARSHLS